MVSASSSRCRIAEVLDRDMRGFASSAVRFARQPMTAERIGGQCCCLRRGSRLRPDVGDHRAGLPHDLAVPYSTVGLAKSQRRVRWPPGSP